MTCFLDVVLPTVICADYVYDVLNTNKYFLNITYTILYVKNKLNFSEKIKFYSF